MIVFSVQLVLYSFVLALMVVLLTMGGMMYFRWRTQLYLTLFGAFLLGLLASIGMFALPNKFSAFYMFFLSLHTCSFILVQISLFRFLFNKRNDKLYGHLIGTAMTLLTAAISIFLPPQMTNLLLLFIMGGVTGYSIFKLFPEVGMKPRNVSALACYFVYIVINTAAAMSKMDSLLAVGLVFNTIALLMIFVGLFERVIEIMQAAAYTSTRDEITGLYTRKHFIQQANQHLLRGHAHGLIYILIDFTKEKNTQGSLSLDDRFREIGPKIHKYIDRFGISCRYEQEGIALIITKSAMELVNLCDSIKMNIEGEIPNTIAVGFMNIEEGVPLEQLLQGARQGAVRAQTNGLDKMFDLSQSRILSDNGVGL